MKRVNMHAFAMWLEILCDIFSMTAAYLILLIFFGIYSGVEVLDASYIYFGILSEAVAVIILYMLDAYGSIESYFAKKRRLFVMLGIAQIISAVTTFFITLILSGIDFIGIGFGTAYYILGFCLMMISHRLVLKLLIKIRGHRELLILFPEGYPEVFLEKLKKNSDDFGRVCVYKIPSGETEVSDAAARLIRTADRILIASNISEDLRNKYILSAASRKNGDAAPNIEIISTVENLAFLGGRVTHVGDTPTIAVRNGRPGLLVSFFKRAFDLIAATVGLVLLSPIFLICAVAIKRDTPGPVFYKQERYTINKKKFNIIKFRTMVKDAEKMGIKLATENDSRITKVGKILRACRLDELPQLINIIKGEMSIVGPRPERPIYADEYSRMVKNYDVRYLVKAGLTGYAQIYGRYNTKVSDKVLLDSIYIYTFSAWLDIKLIVLTIMIMFTKESTEGVDEEMASVPVSNSDKIKKSDKKEPILR